MKGLKQRWGVTTNWQLAIIFVVFAITGSASAYLSKPFCVLLGIGKEDLGYWFTPVRLLLIFPIYQVLLVAIGFLFGQFNFFWTFEKKCSKEWGWDFCLKNNFLLSDSKINRNLSISFLITLQSTSFKFYRITLH